MSRRKSGLNKADLAALEHLPAVLTALEHLAEQRERVASLTARLGGGALLFDPKHDYAPATIPAATMEGVGASIAGPIHPPRTGYEVSPAERAEFEEAKKTGKPVPDVNPLANIREAQKERMAEQRALVQVMRAAKGLPVRVVVDPTMPPGTARLGPVTITNIGTDDDAPVVVRTEELRTSEDGSVGATVRSGASDEVLRAEES